MFSILNSSLPCFCLQPSLQPLLCSCCFILRVYFLLPPLLFYLDDSPLLSNPFFSFPFSFPFLYFHFPSFPLPVFTKLLPPSIPISCSALYWSCLLCSFVCLFSGPSRLQRLPRLLCLSSASYFLFLLFLACFKSLKPPTFTPRKLLLHVCSPFSFTPSTFVPGALRCCRLPLSSSPRSPSFVLLGTL